MNWMLYTFSVQVLWKNTIRRSLSSSLETNEVMLWCAPFSLLHFRVGWWFLQTVLGFHKVRTDVLDNHLLILTTYWIHSNKVSLCPFHMDHTTFTRTPDHGGEKFFIYFFGTFRPHPPLISGVSNVRENTAPNLSPWLLMQTPRYPHSPVASSAQLSISIA